jgi:hypothetical protein
MTPALPLSSLVFQTARASHDRQQDVTLLIAGGGDAFMVKAASNSRSADTERRLKMSATLKLTHKSLRK